MASHSMSDDIQIFEWEDKAFRAIAARMGKDRFDE